MSSFPTTSTALLETLAGIDTGVDQAAWCRFFERYQPVMVEFARAKGAGDDAEDVVQEVFADLVKVFREGKYVRERGRFRSYLAAMLRNELVGRFRRMKARPEGAAADVSAEEALAAALPAAERTPSVPREADDERAWRLANHRVSVNHVLTKTALSEQSRRIYRELLETGESCAEVARRLGIPAATVRQVKSRVSRMIVAYEKAVT
jgi:RNA polymerase sigma factor (sigma-70 family)